MRALISLAATLVLTAVVAGDQAAVTRPTAVGTGGVTTAQIEKPTTDSWVTYNGDYSGRRFSTLNKITAANVKNLSLAWLYDLPAGGTVKATPLQVDGVLYFTTPGETASGVLIAMDDFNVSLRDASGIYRTFKRTPAVKIVRNDPLEAHHALLETITDKNMHDVVAYLESLK